MSIEDDKIISLFKKSKREGFEQLYSAYYRYVYKLCYRITYNREEAVDLLQDIFLKIYIKIDTFDDKKPLLPWIRKITVNVCINHNKRSKPFELSIDSDTHSANISTYNSVDGDPAFAAESNETLTSIEAAVLMLPYDEKVAVILRHFESLSYLEIAEMMGCPVGTIKTYLFRGRRMLRERLIKEGLWEV